MSSFYVLCFIRLYLETQICCNTIVKFVYMEKLKLNDSLRYLNGLRNGFLTIMFIGKTGDGKSATINTLIHNANEPKPNFFKEEESPNSVTKNCEERVVNFFGLRSRLLDTVGLFDTETTQGRIAEVEFMKIPNLEENHKFVLTNLANAISLCTDGIDAFVIVINGTNRIGFETKETIMIIQRFFGSSMLDHCIFALTSKRLHSAPVKAMKLAHSLTAAPPLLKLYFSSVT